MKKILFVTYDFPYPTNTGGKNRAYHMLKYSGADFEKYLFSFVRPDFKEEYMSEMKQIGVEVVGTVRRKKVTDVSNIVGLLSGSSIFKALYYSKALSQDLLEITRDKKIDIVHFESFYTGFYISEEIRKMGAVQIYGSENIEFKLYEDYAAKASMILRPLYNLQVQKIKEEEMKMYRQADVTLAVTRQEREFIKKHSKECEVIPNGVDLERIVYAKPREKVENLLFVGNFTYFPNLDAINFFYNEVFKNLRHDFQLTIVGKKVGSLPFAKEARIKTVEFIPDVANAYKSADIMVSPVRIGGGTNFKILEAMAAGVPVVALPQRLEGLDVASGKNILIARNASEFVSQINRLADDFSLRKKIAKDARELAEHEYSWRVIGNNLATIWKNL